MKNTSVPERKRANSYKLIITITSIGLLICIIAGLVIFNSNSKALLPDNDTGFYTSEYMTYNNGTLTVKNPANNTYDIYNLSKNTKETISSDKFGSFNSVGFYGTKTVYTESNKVLLDPQMLIDGSTLKHHCTLYVHDSQTDKNEVINTSCLHKSFSKDKVAFTDENQNIYVYDVLTNKTDLICEQFEKEITGFKTTNDCVVVFSTREKIDSYTTVFDINTGEKLSEFLIEEKNTDFYVELYNNKILVKKYGKFETLKINNFAYSIKDNNKYSFYDLKGNKLNSTRPDFISVGEGTGAFNSDYFYYNNRVVDSDILHERTVAHPINGLYKTNLITNETEKITDECEFECLLATENYLYCFTTKYTFPQEILKTGHESGYAIKQIPINE